MVETRSSVYPKRVERSFRAKRLILKTIATARRFRFWLAAGVGLLVILQIVAFSPRKLEEEGAPEAIDAESLRPNYADSFVSPTIPQDRVPEYTVEGFQQVSTQAGTKQWLVQAERAFYYQADGIVHARQVHADLYDAQGKITVVTSKEAKYFMQSKDLELFGDVKTVYPSGLETLSPYMLYQGATKEVTVPVAYPVEGKSVPLATAPPNSERYDFRSKGLHYSAVEDRVELLSDVEVRVLKPDPKKGTEVTTIDSDRATIDKKKDVIRFTMLEARPADLRFVKIVQPGMTSRSRRAEFKINANPRKLRTVKALDDVKIEEKPKVADDASVAEKKRTRGMKSRYATAGIAEFDSEKNLIILRDYPQVYQDRDTITGETIVVHRDSDLVEVDQSNAFSEGELEE
jgi:lipopolysaccharide export system protein LptC